MMNEVEYVVGVSGEKKAVIIPLDKYEEIMEELHDLRIIAERKNEEELPFDVVKERLKRDGLLD